MQRVSVVCSNCGNLVHIDETVCNTCGASHSTRQGSSHINRIFAGKIDILSFIPTACIVIFATTIPI